MAQLNAINAGGGAPDQLYGGQSFSPWQSPVYDPETGNFTFPGFGQAPQLNADAPPRLPAPTPTAAAPTPGVAAPASSAAPMSAMMAPSSPSPGGGAGPDAAGQAADQAARGQVDPNDLVPNSPIGWGKAIGTVLGAAIPVPGASLAGRFVGGKVASWLNPPTPANSKGPDSPAVDPTEKEAPGTVTIGQPTVNAAPTVDTTTPTVDTTPTPAVDAPTNAAPNDTSAVGSSEDPNGNSAEGGRAQGGAGSSTGGPGTGTDPNGSGGNGGNGTGGGTGGGGDGSSDAGNGSFARGGMILPSLPKLPGAGGGGLSRINAGGGGFAASAARRFGTNASGGVNQMPLGGAGNTMPGFNAPPQRLARGGLAYKAPMPGNFRSGFSAGSIPQHVQPQPTQQQRYAQGGTVISGAMDEDHARALHYANGGDIRAGGPGTANANQAFTGGGDEGQGDNDDFSGLVQGPGGGNDDDVKANLNGQEIDVSNGEYVLDEQTTKFFGPDFLKNLQAIAAKASGMPPGTDDNGQQPPPVAGAQQPGGVNQMPKQGQVAPPAESGVDTGQGDDFLTQQEQAIGPDGAGYGMAQGAGSPIAAGQPSSSPAPPPPAPGGRYAAGGPLGNGWSSTSGYPSPIQPRDVPMAARPAAAVGGNGLKEGMNQGFVNSRSMVPTDDGIPGKGSRTAGGLRSIHAR